MKMNRKKMELFSRYLDGFIIIMGIFTFCYWFTGEGLFYSENSPVLSPFTSISLVLMALTRLAAKTLSTWSKPMTLALLGMVACGNLSSLWIQLSFPDLFLKAMPAIVSTSAMTSGGLIIFCLYEILVVIRKTPHSAFIFDDILIHLALFPGGLSLLGHILDVQFYMSSNLDLRVGVSLLEMLLMGSFAVAAVISNPHLFLWRFLKQSLLNRITFALLFVNQYIAPLIVGFVFRTPDMPTDKVGIEFFVMLAGVLAVFIFLTINAFCKNCSDEALQEDMTGSYGE